MSEQIKGQLLNTFTGIISGLVVIFLDKNGLTSPVYIVFGLYIFVSVMVLIKHIKAEKITENSVKQEQKTSNNVEYNEQKNTKNEVLHNVLSLIAKYQSQEIPVTPRKLAKELEIDEGIMLAHLCKYHNEQYMTFRTGGKKPDLDTSFFLSPKAWELIKIVRA